MEINLEKQENEETKEYGGFWIRFAAYLIDSIVIGIPLSILSIIIFMIFFGTSGAYDVIFADPEYMDPDMVYLGSYFGAMGITTLINIGAVVAYFAGLHASKWQATVGKKLLGLKVTDLHGNRISFWRAFGRYLAMSFLSGILLIGYIIAAFTEKKQALHDLIAGTIVIKKS
ncbi:RDD family protein [Bacillus sp. FJAT-29790]|uniref:RDD family protein n=1 Tax=Bacillus sp. FJAT-29790 TaxID=1895002 RepID=UPI001C243FAF|nr:RDD family protein [Bacillus sp. FJAT-29790]